MLGSMYWKSVFSLWSITFLGREELLTEHVMAWNYRKILNLAEALSKRFLKVTRVCLYSGIFNSHCSPTSIVEQSEQLVSIICLELVIVIVILWDQFFYILYYSLWLSNNWSNIRMAFLGLVSFLFLHNAVM